MTDRQKKRQAMPQSRPFSLTKPKNTVSTYISKAKIYIVHNVLENI